MTAWPFDLQREGLVVCVCVCVCVWGIREGPADPRPGGRAEGPMGLGLAGTWWSISE